ncbi:MAG: DUF4160 domain-containing protein [Bacteroidota bacterium]|nr:DUF4160 domain-containing protein [Bacteroidota bacterium]
MKVLDGDGCAIYIYDEEHPPPHCHVIYTDKSEIVVGLPFLEGWYGKNVGRKLKRFLNENLETLTEAWDKRHPKRIKK